ncbi:hypothetical protein RINTHM_320 [Richelia intracellularis HM01]|uniref:hypothetical protein n=1 Tax=Richelia intracellularis TaxID=1164990 RepID=UPI0002B5F787|nr:hypothetical protein [Richelia intracellularis]CCH64515.1 hypothetical protein RINTHM_320 [Richelia intracellularis HM01]
MSEHPRSNPNNSSPKSTEIILNPILAQALASLEVQLDEELARYRRTRIGSRTPNPPRIVNSTNKQSLGLKSFSPIVDPSNSLAITESKTDTYASIAKTKEIREVCKQNQSTKTAKTPNAYSSGNIAPADAKGDVNISAADARKYFIEPEDCVEYSGAPLHSLMEEQKQTTTQGKNKNDISILMLISNLGLGCMLLLISAVAIVYLVLNRRIWPQINFIRLLQNQLPEITDTRVSNSNITNQKQTPSYPIRQYPNLGVQEVPEVDKPRKVVGLNPKTENNTVVVPIQTFEKSTPKSKVTSTPKTFPVASQLSLAIKPSSDGFYHIVTENQSNNILTKAKTIVGDAYLSNNKKIIYLGAVKTKARAEKLLKQLKAQGLINATIKQP